MMDQREQILNDLPDNIGSHIERCFDGEIGEHYYHHGEKKRYRIETVITEQDVDFAIDNFVVDQLGRYRGEKLTLLTIGNGGKPFSLELIKRLTQENGFNPDDINWGYIGASSYNGQTQGNGVNISSFIPPIGGVTDRHVLFVDGVADNITTLETSLNESRKEIIPYNPLSSASCLLISKQPENTTVGRGFDTEHSVFYLDKSLWVCGVGPDYDHWHRQIPGGGIGRVVWID